MYKFIIFVEYAKGKILYLNIQRAFERYNTKQTDQLTSVDRARFHVGVDGDGRSWFIDRSR